MYTDHVKINKNNYNYVYTYYIPVSTVKLITYYIRTTDEMNSNVLYFILPTVIAINITGILLFRLHINWF